jgi:hypothetical protein
MVKLVIFSITISLILEQLAFMANAGTEGMASFGIYLPDQYHTPK